jgi:hypothetical protein
MKTINSTDKRIKEIYGGLGLSKDEIIRIIFEFNETLKLENSDLYKENERLWQIISKLKKSKIINFDK